MNLILFISVLMISFIVVRIGAIAFQLTGLEWSLAKFQALSCFTGTGFTTKEAELITASRQRRRIASVLIVLGHAGLVILIATFANSVTPHFEEWSIPFLPASIPAWSIPLINLAIIAAAIYVVYRAFTRPKFVRRITNSLREKIIRRQIIKPVSFEELAIATGGYGVSKIEVCKGSPVSDKTLSESDLRSHDITVLAVVRAGETIPNPSARTKVMVGDELLCFGKLENIRNRICMASS
jgi:hypothetical protein